MILALLIFHAFFFFYVPLFLLPLKMDIDVNA